MKLVTDEKIRVIDNSLNLKSEVEYPSRGIRKVTVSAAINRLARREARRAAKAAIKRLVDQTTGTTEPAHHLFAMVQNHDHDID